jgi:hypothetical protein
MSYVTWYIEIDIESIRLLFCFDGFALTFFKPNKINFLPSNQVLDRKPDRVTGYKVLIDLTSLVYIQTIRKSQHRSATTQNLYCLAIILYFNYNCKDSVE